MNPIKTKCRSCGNMRIPEQFVYSNKVNKSCIKCRNKRSKYRSKTHIVESNAEYQHAVIYFISTENPTTKKISVYVGSTKCFNIRKQGHKSSIYISENKLYTTIRNNGNWKMEKIKCYPCDNIHELEIEEYKHIINLTADLNLSPSYDYLISKPNWEKEKRDSILTRNYMNYPEQLNKSKCSKCKSFRDKNHFVYNNKIYKICIKCKNKRETIKTKLKIYRPNEIEPNPLERFIRHQKLFKKINNQFMSYAYEAVHVYDMRYALVDIRDCLSISNERQYSFSV